MSLRSSALAALLGTIAISACAPTWASLIFNGVTYALLESTTADPKTDQFTLDITGINAPVSGGQGDTEGGRFGVNSFAFNEPIPGSVVSGTLNGFTFMTGGLSAMGCDGHGNFFCFKANTAPGAPALPANSELQLTFDVTVAQAGDFANYDPTLKIQWLGSKAGGYNLVSQTLTPTPVPLPATLPLLFSVIAGLGLIGRRKPA